MNVTKMIGGTMSVEQNQKEIVDLLRKLLIVQLSMLGLPQTKIREIVKCDNNLVSEILKNSNRTLPK